MAENVRVNVTVNGESRQAEVEPRLLLVHYLRDNLGLTGTHIGCDTSNCGACTVLLDGESVKSCTVLAAQAGGRGIDGLGAGGARMSAVADATATSGGPIGRRMKRKEDPRLITGRGNYVDDISLPGMLYMALVRSPIAHGKITSIDTSGASGL